MVLMERLPGYFQKTLLSSLSPLPVMAVFMNQNLKTLFLLSSFWSSGTNLLASGFLSSLLDPETINSSNLLSERVLNTLTSPSPFNPLKAIPKSKVLRACRFLTMDSAKITAPSSPTQFSMKLIESYSSSGSLAKAWAVTLAPLIPTLFTPHLRLSFLSLVSVCNPSTTCLYPRYPKFLVATPRSRTSRFCSLLKAFPTCSPPSLVIPLKSRFSLNSLSWVRAETPSLTLLAPVSVRLLKYRSNSKDWSLVSCWIPSPIGWIPSAPNLFEKRLRLNSFSLSLAPSKYSFKAFPNSRDNSSPIRTRVSSSNLLNCFNPSISSLPPALPSLERINDNLKLFKFFRGANALPVTFPGSVSLSIASNDRSNIWSDLGNLFRTCSSPSLETLVLPKLSFRVVSCGRGFEKSCPICTSSKSDEEREISASWRPCCEVRASWKWVTKFSTCEQSSVSLR